MNVSNDSKGRAIREDMKVLFNGVDSSGTKRELELYTSRDSGELIFKDATGTAYDVMGELFEAHTSPQLSVVGYVADLCKVCGDVVGQLHMATGDFKVHIECFYDDTIPDAPSKMLANFEELEAVRKGAINARLEAILNL